MNDTYLTVAGNLVDDPRLRQTKNGHLVANFRIASTSRRYDRENERYVDGSTLFIQVSAWRTMAENVVRSLHKGQPVVVHGRFQQHEYRKDEANRVAYELEASTIGHDLSRGVAEFERVRRVSAPTTVEADPDGLPTDDSDHWIGVVDEAFAAEIDPRTGEVIAAVAAEPADAASSERAGELVGSR